MSAARLLIVEDDGDLRRMFAIALRFAGYEIREAADGLDALPRPRLRSPDLVVLDLNLPTVGGLLVQQEIAANALTRHIPVLVVTGSDLNLDHLDLACVLRKPVSPDKLVAAVRKCLPSGAPGAVAG